MSALASAPLAAQMVEIIPSELLGHWAAPATNRRDLMRVEQLYGARSSIIHSK